MPQKEPTHPIPNLSVTKLRTVLPLENLPLPA